MAQTLWRHNQAGDLPGENDTIDLVALAQLAEANVGKRGFTYTHKPMTADNAAAVKQANARGFTINLSADNLSEADDLAEMQVGPVVVVLLIAKRVLRDEITVLANQCRCLLHC